MAIDTTVLIGLGVFLFSLAVLSASAVYLVKSFSHIAKAVGISTFVVGAVVLAMVTSLPEFTNMLFSNFMKLTDLGIGDIIGACITNLCLSAGIVSLIVTSKVKEKVEYWTFVLSLIPLLMFFWFGSDGLISRLEGAMFLAIFFIYQYYLFKKGITISRRHPPFKKLALAYFMAPPAIFALIIGAYLVVSSAGYLAVVAGIPVAVIGLTLVAIGTSLPELSSSIVSAIKHKEELALGNLIGSNILNIFFVIGLVSLILPIKFSFELFKIPLYIVIAATIFFIAYVLIRKQADKWLGVVLIATYIAYLYYNYLLL